MSSIANCHLLNKFAGISSMRYILYMNKVPWSQIPFRHAGAPVHKNVDAFVCVCESLPAHA